jgi:hypothetical protein
MDLSKAFDSISHKILLNKLKRYGIRDNAIDWLTSYLENREQYVEINGQNAKGEDEIFRSPSDRIKCGVPQGSVLGPVLFNVYINDVVEYLKKDNSKIVLFADDSTLSVSHTSMEMLEVEMYIQLNRVTQWFKQNQLVLNEMKTKFMIYTSRHNTGDMSIVINDVHLEQVTGVTFLGMEADDRLHWKLHIDKLERKLSSGLYVLRRLKHYRNQQLLLLAYYAIVESHIRYGISLWGDSSQKNADRIFKMQKKAVRTILGLQRTNSCRRHFLNLGIMTVPCIYIHSTIMMAVSNGALKTKNIHVHKHNTRAKRNVHVEPSRLVVQSKAPSRAAIKLFNRLPLYIKETEPKELSSILKKFLISKCYYSVKDFMEN